MEFEGEDGSDLTTYDRGGGMDQIGSTGQKAHSSPALARPTAKCPETTCSCLCRSETTNKGVPIPTICLYMPARLVGTQLQRHEARHGPLRWKSNQPAPMDSRHKTPPRLPPASSSKGHSHTAHHNHHASLWHTSPRCFGRFIRASMPATSKPTASGCEEAPANMA